MNDWTPDKSLELYQVAHWAEGFFGINEAGNVEVHPDRSGEASVDLLELVGDLRARGLRSPMLIRFSDILDARIREVSGAFRIAIDEYEYGGRYRGVYPIKVNQQRRVVEEIVQFGAPLGVGLEAGSKPELLVALALLDSRDSVIICNGYKDRAYIETALLAQRLGRTPIVVVDRFRELELLIKTASELGIRPHIGFRARLTTRGAGRFSEPSGRSKFGLSAAELVAGIERLRSEQMLDCLELLHSHIGSQITAIHAHKDALRELGRIYVGLRRLGADALAQIDVGGGLGVDYDGSKTNFHSSMNYSVQEYANDVVASLQEAADEAELPHPDIISESGRALVAHHSVLVFDVLDVNEMLPGRPAPPVAPDDHKVMHDLSELYEGITADNVQEAYHDAQQLREQTAALFSMGYLDLAVRARADRYFLHCCEKILSIVRDLGEVPDELAGLEKNFADTYYGNFSVFQSAPDHWAVKQLFPVMPIHRLDEEPTRRGIFADLTCDGDGKIDKFIGSADVLKLHPWNDRGYFIGVFLVGAYQEILGDLHNLFGDTDAVHVRLDAEGGYTIEHVVEGDEVADVLRYVEYDPKSLIEKVRRTTEIALRRNQISLEDSLRLRRRYEQGLREYTYLSRDD